MAAATLPSAAAQVGTMRAAEMKNKSKPSVWLRAPGVVVTSSVPVASHVPPSRPMPVPPTESRDKKPNTEAKSSSGTAKVSTTMAIWWDSSWGTHESWRPERATEAAPRAENPSGMGLPTGRSMILDMASTRFCAVPSSTGAVCWR